MILEILVLLVQWDKQFLSLGLSIAQPNKKVLLFTGDGDMLMSLGSLATIANHPMPNLTVLVMDNESYVETGSQPTATAGKTDLE